VIPGVGGWALITAVFEAREVHPAAFFTVKVYEPVARPDMVAVVPVPEAVVPPGADVTVQVPDAGNPVRVILPVDIVQLGCAIVPTTGETGVAGWVLITTPVDPEEVHPTEFVTV
jgi:hypothetical protein